MRRSWVCGLVFLDHRVCLVPFAFKARTRVTSSKRDGDLKWWTVLNHGVGLGLGLVCNAQIRLERLMLTLLPTVFAFLPNRVCCNVMTKCGQKSEPTTRLSIPGAKEAALNPSDPESPSPSSPLHYGHFPTASLSHDLP